MGKQISLCTMCKLNCKQEIGQEVVCPKYDKKSGGVKDEAKRSSQRSTQGIL